MDTLLFLVHRDGGALIEENDEAQGVVGHASRIPTDSRSFFTPRSSGVYFLWVEHFAIMDGLGSYEVIALEH